MHKQTFYVSSRWTKIYLMFREATNKMLNPAIFLKHYLPASLMWFVIKTAQDYKLLTDSKKNYLA